MSSVCVANYLVKVCYLSIGAVSVPNGTQVIVILSEFYLADWPENQDSNSYSICLELCALADDWYWLSVALVAFTNWYCAESVLQKSAGTPTEPTVDRYLPEIPLTWNLTTGFYSIRGVFRTLTCLIWFSIGSDMNFLDFSTSAATCFIVDNFRLGNRIGASSSFILSFWNFKFRLFTYLGDNLTK